jgi:peptide-methionine (R)-S-oxide reductase
MDRNNGKKNHRLLLLTAIAALVLLAASQLWQSENKTWAQGNNTAVESGAGRHDKTASASGASGASVDNLKNKPESYWKTRLSPETFYVTRQKGTEPAFTGAYWNNHTTGDYYCSNCGALLFTSKEKFDSGTGWPSFYKPVDNKSVDNNTDKSLMMQRTEVVCSHCGAHLGHVFDDGPKPTGLRYCINSCSINFKAEPTTKNATTTEVTNHD